MEFRFFEIYRSQEYMGLLAEGAAFSSALAIGSGALGFVLAAVLSSLRYFEVPGLRHFATAYVEVIRNTPLIVQLFFFAFGLPLLVGYAWPFWAHALLALTINFSGYFSEILRAGYAAVPTGQVEAAMALGVKKITLFRKIVFPQAVAAMYSSLNSQFIFLFLTTGVIAEIGVTDLTSAGLFIDSRTFRSFEVFITLTAIYILLALSFKALLNGAYYQMFQWKRAR